MPITSIFDRTVTAQRLTPIYESNGDEYADNATDVACTIQPVDDSYTEDLTGSYGKDFVMFCLPADIADGDRIVDGATAYKVCGVESHDFQGEKHMEIRVRHYKE